MMQLPTEAPVAEPECSTNVAPPRSAPATPVFFTVRVEVAVFVIVHVTSLLLTVTVWEPSRPCSVAPGQLQVEPVYPVGPDSDRA